jgi:hypothetical protein
VDLLVACPFCSTDNRVKVEEHLLKTVTVHRGDSSGTAVDLSQRGALLNYVFDGQKPTTS